MSGDSLKHYATDKEVFDLLISLRQKMPESVLHEIANEKGIYYSRHDSRDAVAAHLAQLPHDYEDLQQYAMYAESSGRAEKVTSVTLNAELSIDELKAVATEYKEAMAVSGDERVIAQSLGKDSYVVNVQYSELDFSKTRLLQRRKKEAEIEFFVQEGRTLVRMPANEKAKDVVAKLTESLEQKKKSKIPQERIELSSLPSTERKTEFFTTLIKDLPGYKLEDVTSVKVEHAVLESPSEDFADEDLADEVDEEAEQASAEMLAVVKSVALQGQSLLASGEFKDLKARGFFITSIVWTAKQTTAPYNVAEFEAGFENAAEGTGFRYTVKGEYKRRESGEYLVTRTALSEEQQNAVLLIIEETSKKTLLALKEKAEPSNAKPMIGGTT